MELRFRTVFDKCRILIYPCVKQQTLHFSVDEEDWSICFLITKLKFLDDMVITLPYKAFRGSYNIL